MVRFYLPVPALDNPAFKDMVNKMPPSRMKRMSLFSEKNPLVCSPRISPIEVWHNNFIQWRFFKDKITEHSNPVYKWKTDKQFHINKYNDGYSRIIALEINLDAITGEEQIKTVFHIIEFSYWTNYTAPAVHKWISRNYETLDGLGLRVLRLPYINNPTVALPQIPQEISLLYLGMTDSPLRPDGSLKDRYYIWNSLNVVVYKAIKNIKSSYLSAQSLRALMGDLLDDYLSKIDRLIERFDNHLKDNTTSAPIETSVNKDPVQSIFGSKVSETDKLSEKLIVDRLMQDIIEQHGENVARSLCRALMDRYMKI